MLWVLDEGTVGVEDGYLRIYLHHIGCELSVSSKLACLG